MSQSEVMRARILGNVAADCMNCLQFETNAAPWCRMYHNEPKFVEKSYPCGHLCAHYKYGSKAQTP